MRIFLFLFIVLFQAYAIDSYSQESRISVTATRMKLDQFFKAIEKQSSFMFFYVDSDIEGIDVNVNVKEASVTAALNQALSKTGLVYEMHGRYITILPARLAGKEQGITIAGTVTDENGEAMPGVNVLVKGTTVGVVTGYDGKYSISIPDRAAVLVFSFMGYTAQEVIVGNRTGIDVVLNEDVREIDEVVVVGYGTQKKSTLTGSVASVKSEKLTVAPITNIMSTLGGQLPGLTTKQTSGWPGSDDSWLLIRGAANPLVIVDGVEAAFNHLDPSQVESMTILKDGSASIYGARAGNGVILVTTKRGVESKPTITLNSSLTMQGSTRIFPATNSGQRAEYANEQHRHQGLPEAQIPYAEDEIFDYYDGRNPNYPNADWFGETIRSWAPQQNHNVSVRGGSEKIKYYGYLGYNNQETIIRHDGGHYTRYNLQSNIDAKITDRLTASVDMSLIHRHQLTVADESNNHQYMWVSIYDSDPKYHVWLPDRSKLAYNGNYSANPIYNGSTVLRGYSDTRNTFLRANGSLSYDFKYIKGLKAKALVNYNYSLQWYKHMNKEADFYTYNYDSEVYTYVRKSDASTNLSRSSSVGSELTQQYSLSYTNKFNDIHDLTALVVFESVNTSASGFSTLRTGFTNTLIEEFPAGDATTATNDSQSNEMGRASWIGRINYSLMNRYLVEGILRADASARFDPDYRWGYFPSISVGWILSQEEFMDFLPALDNMKLRLSMGQSGYDNIGNFEYLNTYSVDMQYMFGNETLTGLYQTRIANPAFSWEKMTIYNAGLDFSFLHRMIYGTAEAFYRLRDGILGTRSRSIPSSFGQVLPTENLNSQDTRGFEVTLGSSGRAGDFSYDVSGNISWNRSQWIKYDEPEYEDEDQQRISGRSGRWTDVRYGYLADGLFTSQNEIDELTYVYDVLGSNSTLRMGDVKYRNLNDDDKLDWRDQTIIGSGSTPHWMYGANIYLRYKNVDLSALFQGAFGYTTNIALDPLRTQYGFEHRWTDENNDPHALVPRVGGSTTNGMTSDYNNHSTSYLRLKNLSLGYDFSSNLLRKANIEKLRIYLAGTNLLTFSSVGQYGVDPEMPEGSAHMYYPQQRTFSAGLNISF
ncbi:MAG: TonB-dependent receptor [Bacteroidales bacterium]|nr:TonB-dependent receptor [Bacteroidales bacterium]